MEFLDYLEENNIDYTEEDGKIVIPGDLDLDRTQITKFPDSLSVKGDLNLRRTKNTKLPNKLSVGGCVDLSNSEITELPNKLSVGGYLDLSKTQITELPDNLSIGEILFLDTENIINIAYRKDCTWRGSPTIFAAYVNGEIQIAAGCFLGNIEKFESAVDKKYLGADAEKYKQAAQECIKELEEMRSR